MPLWGLLPHKKLQLHSGSLALLGHGTELGGHREAGGKLRHPWAGSCPGQLSTTMRMREGLVAAGPTGGPGVDSVTCRGAVPSCPRRRSWGPGRLCPEGESQRNPPSPHSQAVSAPAQAQHVAILRGRQQGSHSAPTVTGPGELSFDSNVTRLGNRARHTVTLMGASPATGSIPV